MTIRINGEPPSAATPGDITREIANKVRALASVATELRAPMPVTAARDVASAVAVALAQVADVIAGIQTVTGTRATAIAAINAAINLTLPRFGGARNFIADLAAVQTAAEAMAAAAATDLHAAPLTVSATDLTIAMFTPSAALIAACDAVLAAIGTLPGR